MTRIRAIAFDLDDTLSDWWTGIARAADAVGDPGILDRVKADAWIRREGVVVDRHHWRVKRDAHEFMAAELVAAFDAALDIPLFDDVRPTLEALSTRTRLALLTNNPYGAEVLAMHGLHVDVFECVVIVDPEFRKPHPRAFAPLIEALRLQPAEIAYVGDTITADVEGALAGGLRPVWLDRWSDPWPVPDGVTRIASLRDLERMAES
jgi:HAD superfamily hydrolase (TIGR01549 family)